MTAARACECRQPDCHACELEGVKEWLAAQGLRVVSDRGTPTGAAIVAKLRDAERDAAEAWVNAIVYLAGRARRAEGELDRVRVWARTWKAIAKELWFRRDSRLAEELRRLRQELRDVLVACGAHADVEEGRDPIEAARAVRAAELFACDEAAGLRDALAEWQQAGARVGVHSPGAMQQARHMAVAACEALGLPYDDTAPSDIREAIARLREAEPDPIEPARPVPPPEDPRPQGTPPARPVWWDIVTVTGVRLRGYGQTAFAAASQAGLSLTEVAAMHPTPPAPELPATMPGALCQRVHTEHCAAVISLRRRDGA